MVIVDLGRGTQVHGPGAKVAPGDDGRWYVCVETKTGWMIWSGPFDNEMEAWRWLKSPAKSEQESKP